MNIFKKIEQFLKDNKTRFLLLLCGGVIFIVGYGTGSVAPQPRAPQNISNYTTSGAKTQNTNGTTTTNSAPKSSSKPSGDPTCPIKGNIGSDKVQKYYLAGDRGYTQVKPEQCFATEEEAAAAGFIPIAKVN